MQIKNGSNFGAGAINDNGSNLITVGRDAKFSGPNPWVDVRAYGVRAVNPAITPAATGLTANCVSGNPVVTISSASTFVNGDGVILYNCGAPHSMSTPSAPTLTPSIADGPTGTQYVVPAPAGALTAPCYIIAARDISGGLTAGATEVCPTTGNTNGQQTVAITSHSRANNTVTVTTTAAHGLPVGCASGQCGVVIISATDQPKAFDGIFPISTVPNNTSFTYVGGQDTRYGALAAGTGGTLIWFNTNKLTLPAGTAGVWQYVVWAGNSGAETLYGVSLPIISLYSDDPTALLWNDYGSTLMGNISLPKFYPNTPPATPTSDNLVTTIVSGAGTTSLTLAQAPGTNQTGTTIRFDNAPNLRAAYLATTNQTTGGGTLYFPAVSPASSAYVTNSFVDFSDGPVPITVAQAGSVDLGDTLRCTCIWYGDLIRNGIQYNQPGFATQGQIPIFNRAGNPGIVLTGTINAVSLTLNGNAALGILHTNAGPIRSRDVNLASIGNDYLNIGYMYFVSQTSAGFGIEANGWSVNSSQLTYGTTTTPMVVFKNSAGEIAFNYINGGGRGFFFKTVPSNGSFNLRYDMREEWQGNRTPLLMFRASSNIATYEQIWAVLHDTSLSPALAANLTPANFSWQGSMEINGTNAGVGSVGPLLTGRPFQFVTLRNPYGFFNGFGSVSASNNQLGQNANVYAESFPSMIDGVIGPGNGASPTATQGLVQLSHPLTTTQSQYITAIPYAAPTCVVNAGGSMPVGNYTFTYAPVFPGVGNGGEGTTSQPSTTCTTSSGNQSVTITIPAAITGAKGYNYFAQPGSQMVGRLLNAYPNTTPGTNLSLTFSSNFVINAVAQAPGSGPVGMDASGAHASTFTGETYQTVSNCTVNSVSPAACNNAASGAFVVPATTTAYTVNTTAVTANSVIHLTPRTYTGNLPGTPTCTVPTITAEPVVSAIVAGTSFTITISSSAGQTCWNYWIIN